MLWDLPALLALFSAGHVYAADETESGALTARQVIKQIRKTCRRTLGVRDCRHGEGRESRYTGHRHCDNICGDHGRASTGGGIGKNLIIAHEPTFYNHLDQTDELKNDPVYQAKRKFIEEHGMVVFRFHDHWHEHRPDGILTGMVAALRWGDYQDKTTPYLFQHPGVTLNQLAEEAKRN